MMTLSYPKMFRGIQVIFNQNTIFVLGTQAGKEGVVERKYTIAYLDGGTSDFIFVCAYYFRYTLRLCKKAAGMIYSLVQLSKWFSFAARRVDIQMVLDSHRILCSKDSKIFCRKKKSFMSQYPTIPAHFLLIILLHL